MSCSRILYSWSRGAKMRTEVQRGAICQLSAPSARRPTHVSLMLSGTDSLSAALPTCQSSDGHTDSGSVQGDE